MTIGGYASTVISTKPDYASAQIALEAAFDLFSSARDKLLHDDVQGALESSRDAIRLASSAILFRDGCLAVSLEETAGYLSRKYPGAFPLADWDMIEVSATGHTTLYQLLLRAMGKIKKPGREEADKALSIAEAFIQKASSEMRH